MEIRRRNIAAAFDAQIVLTEVNELVGNPRSSSKELARAITPLLGIRWNRETCQRVGGGDLNKLLYRLRNSQLAQAAYQRVSVLFNVACRLEGPVPANWAHRLNIVRKFGPDSSSDICSWREIANDIGANRPKLR